MESKTVGPGRRLLVVEDEPQVRALLAEGLADEGFEVTLARSGDEAAGLVDRPDLFDLLLTDANMPGRLGGLGLAARARVGNPNLPIVVVTGGPELELGVFALQPRCELVLKPFRLSAIVNALARVSV